MAKEVLELEVKSNFSSAVASTKEYAKTLEQAKGNVKELNGSLAAQNQLILDQEKDLQKLQAIQSTLSRGAWNAGAYKRAEDINTVTNSLKQNKLQLKQIKIHQKEANEEVKAFTQANKENSSSLLNDIKNYKVMGVSLNGIGGAFKKLVPLARAAFASIKAGMISTGIGALIVAFGSLVAWFTKTKVGAEALEKIFAVVGAAVKVFVDRFISYGKMLWSILTLDFSGAAENARDAFSGVGDELTREIALALKLKGDLQKLADAERDLNVETAQRKAEISELQRISSDLNLTEGERIDALQRASAIEQELMAKRVGNAEEALRIQQAQMSMSQNMKEDLQKLADLEINLANIRRESSVIQRTLIRKTSQIQKNAAYKERERQNAWARKQNEITRANMALKQEANDVTTLLNEETLKKLAKNELDAVRDIAQARLLKLHEANLKEIEDSKLKDEDKATATLRHMSLFDLKRRAIDREYAVGRKEIRDNETQQLLETQNEIFLAKKRMEAETLAELKSLAEAESKIEMDAEIASVAGLENKLEQEEAIREKYRLIKEERDNEFDEKDKERSKEIADFKQDLMMQGVALIGKGLDLQAQSIQNNYKKEMKLAKANGKSTEKIEKDFQKKMKDNAKKQKALKIGLAIVDTYQSAISAYAAGMSIGGPAGLVLGPVSAGLAVAAGLANVAIIAGTPVGDGGGGGGGGVGGGASAEPPAPEMMSGAFELTGGEEVEPMQAYVVSDEITDSQNALEVIRRRATI